jgi:hypothetical protein
LSATVAKHHGEVKERNARGACPNFGQAGTGFLFARRMHVPQPLGVLTTPPTISNGLTFDWTLIEPREATGKGNL